jgi:hypothetical protein
MATQPRFPQYPEKRPTLVPRSPRRPLKRQSHFRVAIIAAVSFAFALGVVTYLIRRGPAQHEPVSSAVLLQQPNNGELQVDSMQIIDGAGDSVTLTGQITNRGAHTLNGAQVQLAFRGANGHTVATLRRPAAGLSGGNCEVTNEFARHPIKPNDLRFFCVSVSPIPNDWNHELPDTQVVRVTSPD